MSDSNGCLGFMAFVVCPVLIGTMIGKVIGDAIKRSSSSGASEGAEGSGDHAEHGNSVIAGALEHSDSAVEHADAVKDHAGELSVVGAGAAGGISAHFALILGSAITYTIGSAAAIAYASYQSYKSEETAKETAKDLLNPFSYFNRGTKSLREIRTFSGTDALTYTKGAASASLAILFWPGLAFGTGFGLAVRGLKNTCRSSDTTISNETVHGLGEEGSINGSNHSSNN
jgi:hypothetical protein